MHLELVVLMQHVIFRGYALRGSSATIFNTFLWRCKWRVSGVFGGSVTLCSFGSSLPVSSRAALEHWIYWVFGHTQPYNPSCCGPPFDVIRNQWQTLAGDSHSGYTLWYTFIQIGILLYLQMRCQINKCFAESQHDLSVPVVDFPFALTVHSSAS